MNKHVSTKTKRLLIVAPGNLSIPPVGWGAVETIIWESIGTYEDDFDIWLLNSKSIWDWGKAKRIAFDVILSHSDVDCPKIRKTWPNTPLVGVSHYGLGAFPDKWDKGFLKILRGMEHCDQVVCLSHEVKKCYENYISSEKLLVSSNGTSFKPRLSQKKNNKIMYLGKIEARKKQFEIFHSLLGSEIKVDFVGPIVDQRVGQLIENNQSLSKVFIGPMSREKISNELADYSALLLCSQGEADALVLYEAQMAGLPVIVSPESLGAQDERLDWVQVIEGEFTPEKILNALNSVISSPKEIAHYAHSNYSWEARNQKLRQILINLSNKMDRP
jgi:glycosyltransferase involved in cell wall biosynthesis